MRATMHLRAVAGASLAIAVCAIWERPVRPVLASQAVAAGGPAVTAKVWVEREVEFETFLETARITRSEVVGLGVTRPRHVFFAPGGLAESAAWKPLRPGVYKGYYESYRSEIAAYELDKLLWLSMVPVAVERSHEGQAGAIILWVAPVTMYKDLKKETTPSGLQWMRQLDQMRFFDQLIANPDRNSGNFMVDPAGNLILIDHSRAFAPGFRLEVDKLPRFDATILKRVTELTDEQLTAQLGKWLDSGQMSALLKRRKELLAEVERRLGKAVKPAA